MSKEIILDGVEEVNLLEEQKNQSGTFGTTILIDDEVPTPEKPKRKRGPKKRKNGRIKSFNLEVEVADYIEKHCEENDLVETEYVNNILKEHFGLNK